MTEADNAKKGTMPSGWRIGLQVVGFLIGIGILIMLFRNAMQDDGWEEIIDRASPGLLAAMLLCTLISVAANGAIFWTVIHPVRKLGFWDLQWINITATFLNLAPVRIGIVSRVLYHMRVDRMKPLLITGWFVAIIITILVVMGSVSLATVLHPSVDGWWATLAIIPLVLTLAFLPPLVQRPLIQRFTKGGEQMLADRRALSGALGLRLIDLLAWTGRIWLATHLVDTGLSGGDVLLLAVAAVLVNLNPLGRTGYREIAVAWLASLLADGAPAGEDATAALDAQFAQLALIESGAEILVVIPLGVLTTIWWIIKMRRGPVPLVPSKPTS